MAPNVLLILLPTGITTSRVYKMHSFSPCEGSCKSGKISDLFLCDSPLSKGPRMKEKLQK